MPPVCPDFDYETHPKRSRRLPLAVTAVVQDILNDQLTIAELINDCRPTHYRLFFNLTPPGHGYYAGNYRGEQYECLNFRVKVGGKRFAAIPERVADMMDAYARRTEEAIEALDEFHLRQDVDENNKLLATITVACETAYQFWRIHPFLNGNGHMGRVKLFAFLFRYRYRLSTLSIEPRPTGPGYMQAIEAYEAGDATTFHSFVLAALAPVPPKRFFGLC